MWWWVMHHKNNMYMLMNYIHKMLHNTRWQLKHIHFKFCKLNLFKLNLKIMLDVILCIYFCLSETWITFFSKGNIDKCKARTEIEKSLSASLLTYTQTCFALTPRNVTEVLPSLEKIYCIFHKKGEDKILSIKYYK